MNLRPSPTVLFVVPCYNEEEVLDQSLTILLDVLDQLSHGQLAKSDGSGILLVDDGSHDKTWLLIQSWKSRDSRINGVRLSRNKGHQAALLAGLSVAVELSDVTITIDADLQDDVSVCKDMLSFYRQGYDIVFGVRGDRGTDSTSKRFFANSFYSLMMRLGIEIIPGHADFRMMSRQVLKEFLRYKENSLFLRGLITQLGFKSASVYYPRKLRQLGVSKYPFRKSLSLAIDGIISLSYKPLRYIAYIGLFMAVLSCFALVLTVVYYIRGGTIQGWASLMVVIIAIGGVQLLALGLIGEYLGRVYKEVKNRPRFHIKSLSGRLIEEQRIQPFDRK